MHALFLGVGEREERRGAFQQSLEQCGIDAVADDLGETDVAGGIAECIDCGAVAGAGRVEQPRDVQYRDVGEFGGHNSVLKGQ